MIKVRVPATAANIGPGFDCLGVALNIYNDIEVEECNEGLSINISGERCGDVPVDETNLVYRSMKKVFDVAGFSPKGIRLNQKKRHPNYPRPGQQRSLYSGRHDRCKMLWPGFLLIKMN